MLHKYTKNHSYTCILPPSIPGSVGDEKAVAVCVQVLKKDLIILNYEHGSWDFIAPEAKYVSQFGKTDSTAYYHAKGLKKILSILNVGLHLLLHFPSVLNAFRHSRRFVILGMDIMDGHYGHLSVMHKIGLAYIAAWMGVEVSIINCSFNEHPSKLVVFALKHLPKSVRIVGREPTSHARMEKFLRRPIVLAADIVFLFELNPSPVSSLQKEIEWVEGEKQKGQRIVVINIADNKNYDMNVLTSCFIRTIEGKKDVSFALVPHATYDRGNLPNETKLLEKVLSALSEEDRKRCILVRTPKNLSDLQKFLSHAEYGIVGRMHLAITLLCEGIPASCIGYQNKFDGLFVDYLHLPELLLDMKQIMEKGHFIGELEKQLPKVAENSQKIHRKLANIRLLSKANFPAD